LSVKALCQSILTPTGAVIIDVATTKTSAWTLDATGIARGCVFPQLTATDIKSLVSKYRTAMLQYRGQTMSTLLKAVDACDLIDPTQQKPYPCQVQDAATKQWIPDPKVFPALAVPPAPPAVAATAVSLTGIAAMASGGAFMVFTKTDGTVTSRCDSATPSEAAGQCLAPSATTGSLRTAANGQHALALRADGTVVEWGSVRANGTLTTSKTPAGVTSVVDIAAGQDFSLALKSDGSVTAWGDNSLGQTTIPARATGLVAIAAGRCHAVGLKGDGTVVSWGCNNASQLSADGMKAVAIAAHGDTTVLWTSAGTVTTIGASRGSNAPSATGSLTAYDSAAGSYFAGSGACIVDKGEDVTRDGKPSASRAEAPLGLSTDATPTKSDSWIYTWSPPKDTGGSPILRYEGQVYDSKTRTFGPWQTVTSPFTALKQPMPHLSRFSVRAVTSAGTGARAQVATSESRMCGVDQASDIGMSLNRSAVAAPVAPAVIAGSSTAGALKLSWTANAALGGTSRVTATVRLSADAGKTWISYSVPGYAANITGLKGGQSYQVQVMLTNSAGSVTSPTVTAQTVVDAAATDLTVKSIAGRSVSLSWKAPAKLTGATVKDYRIESSTDGAAWVPFVRKASTKTTATFTGLRAATAYQFRVVIVTSSGAGTPTDPVAATTAQDVPAVVAAPTFASVTANAFTITWVAPEDNGGQPITSYSVKVTPVVTSVVVNGTTATVTGFKLGTAYSFTIAATNSKGTGAATTTKMTPVATPGAPILTATRAMTSVTISWKAPSDTGGAKITGYTTSVSPSALAYTVSGTKATFSNLPAGTMFTFSVAAVNSAGAGVAAQIATGTFAVPGPVVITSASKDASTLLISWTTPTDDGGSKITGYRVHTSTDGGKTFSAWANVSGTSITAAKPPAKQTLIIEVAAVNAIGTGSLSSLTVTG
jgi:hypothetical protein